jgi:flagellar FliL protein
LKKKAEGILMGKEKEIEKDINLGDQSKKSKLKNKFLILGGTLLLLGFIMVGALEFFGFFSVFGLSKKETPLTITKEIKDFGPVVKMFPLIVNLKEESGRHYLKATIAIEVGGKKWTEEVQSKMAILNDVAIMILSEKNLEDLKKTHFKEEVKKELMREFSQYFRENQLRQIFFEEFLYQ